MKMKMTDNEIIKALKKILELMCNEGDLQRSAIISKSLDLINRLKAEIERMQLEIDGVKEANCILRNNNEIAINEAVKKFTERLILVEETTAINCATNEKVVRVNDIYNLLKEKVGEDK